MSCGERFTYNDVLENLFDGDSDIDENVSEREEDPEFGVFSSDKNECVDPTVVSEPPANTDPSINVKIIRSLS